MVKVFTTNKDGKIELTKEELQKLLDDAYWEGYRDNGHSWTYTSPSNYRNWWDPYYYTTTTTSTTGSITGTSVSLTNANINNKNSCTIIYGECIN